jgi:DNA primase
MISDKTIQEVRDAADIVQVISNRIKVEKAGIHLKACCPFHNEKSASFVIYPKSNSYHCFGCHASGDAISFVMKHDNLPFLSAVKKLAAELRIEVVETVLQEPDPQFDQKTELRTLLTVAQQAFQKGGEHNEGVKYFLNRGFDVETLTHFGIGYCAGNEKIQGNTEGAGLTNEKGNHKLYKRVTIPLKDHLGNIVAFAGRTLDDEQQPKYLNFGETLLYRKSEILYHLAAARPEIRAKREVWIVEGYADVMAMYQAGYKNTVAICGTALTDAQCEQLSRALQSPKSRIYLALDNDDAGRKATAEALPKLLQMGDVRLVEIEGAKDLGELAIRDPKKISNLQGAAKDALTSFASEKIAKCDESPYAISVVQDEVAAMVAKVKDEDVRNIYIKEIASVVKLQFKELSLKVDKVRNPNLIKKKEELAESEYVKVGDTYLQKILDFDPTKGIYTTRYKTRMRGELEIENNKAFVKAIPRFDDWVTMPAHVDYNRIIEHKHGGLLNRKLNEYEPLPQKPKPFELPEDFNTEGFDFETIPEIKYTAAFFKHIANHKKYKNRYLTLLWDYFTIMYLHPLQNLQALCLVSTEEGTGKSTLINYFVSVFGQNATTITPDRITANFNSQMSGKLFVAVEETSDQRAALENQLKDLITGREIIVERKFQESRREINFLKFIFASNHPEQFLKVGAATTRFAVLHVPQISTVIQGIEDKMIAEIPYVLHFLKERGIVTPNTNRLWFDPTLWENEALLRLRQASKDVVVQNIELLVENIYVKCSYTEPYLRVSSEYMKNLMVLFAGDAFKAKSPNYFSDTMRNKCGCKQSEVPKLYSYPYIAHLNFMERWDYTTEKNKSRYIEIPAFKFISHQALLDNFNATELNEFIKNYRSKLPELIKEWGEDAGKWLNELVEKSSKTVEAVEGDPEWIKGL